jgi:hypothetical protein
MLRRRVGRSPTQRAPASLPTERAACAQAAPLRAPVVMPTGGASGARSKSKRRSSMESPTTASKSANWSPTHLRRPPPKGRYLKFSVTSLGMGASTGKLRVGCEVWGGSGRFVGRGREGGVASLGTARRPGSCGAGREVWGGEGGPLGSLCPRVPASGGAGRRLRAGESPRPTCSPLQCAITPPAAPHRSGSNSWGRSQFLGSRWRFHTEMKMSEPAGTS